MALGNLLDRTAGQTPRVEAVDGASDAAHVYKFRVWSFTGDTSYPGPGGSVLSAAALGLTRIDYLEVEEAGGFVFEYDYVNGKLKAFQDQVAAGVLTEIANATNMSAVVARLFAIGV